jgi:hypothetical protein
MEHSQTSEPFSGPATGAITVEAAYLPVSERYEHTEAGWAGTPMAPAEDDLDLLAESNRRPGKLTTLLIAGILAVLAFGGGVVVQKHYGSSSSGSAAAGGFGQRAGGAGGTGGFPGGAGGGTGAAGGTGTGTGTAGGTGTAAGADASTPAVVGTVVKVSGTTVTVKNFAGKTVKVTVPASTAISLSSALKLTGLKAGTSISIVGTTAADGSVTASAVTATK